MVANLAWKSSFGFYRVSQKLSRCSSNLIFMISYCIHIKFWYFRCGEAEISFYTDSDPCITNDLEDETLLGLKPNCSLQCDVKTNLVKKCGDSNSGNRLITNGVYFIFRYSDVNLVMEIVEVLIDWWMRLKKQLLEKYIYGLKSSMNKRLNLNYFLHKTGALCWEADVNGEKLRNLFLVLRPPQIRI